MIFRQIVRKSISCLIRAHILPLTTRLLFCLSPNLIRFGSPTLRLLSCGLTLDRLILRESLSLALIPGTLALVLVARAFAESVVTALLLNIVLRRCAWGLARRALLTYGVLDVRAIGFRFVAVISLTEAVTLIKAI